MRPTGEENIVVRIHFFVAWRTTLVWYEAITTVGDASRRHVLDNRDDGFFRAWYVVSRHEYRCHVIGDALPPPTRRVCM